MKIYFSPLQLAFYPEDFRDDYDRAGAWPADAFLVPYTSFTKFALTPAPKNKKLGCKSGLPEWVDIELTVSDLELAERFWRNSELVRADVELSKAQDSDPKAVGSVTQWRDYRKALRAWPAEEGFPSPNLRPNPPDNKE